MTGQYGKFLTYLVTVFQQKYPQDDRSDDGREKCAEFFFVKGNHESGSKLGSPEELVALCLWRSREKCLGCRPDFTEQRAVSVSIQIGLTVPLADGADARRVIQSADQFQALATRLCSNR